MRVAWRDVDSLLPAGGRAMQTWLLPRHARVSAVDDHCRSLHSYAVCFGCVFLPKGLRRCPPTISFCRTI